MKHLRTFRIPIISWMRRLSYRPRFISKRWFLMHTSPLFLRWMDDFFFQFQNEWNAHIIIFLSRQCKCKYQVFSIHWCPTFHKELTTKSKRQKAWTYWKHYPLRTLRSHQRRIKGEQRFQFGVNDTLKLISDGFNFYYSSIIEL